MKKTPTMFIRDPGNMRELLDKVNNGCEWVFAGEGVATRKYDGTCCLIKAGKLWKRRETKNDKPNPEGFILADYDESTGKSVGWVPVVFERAEDKYHAKAFVLGMSDGTYELLGPKIQGNPEGLDSYELLKHSNAEQYKNVPREFHALSSWLEGRDIEGIVFHHPDGRMAKIKKRDFGQARRKVNNGI